MKMQCMQEVAGLRLADILLPVTPMLLTETAACLWIPKRVARCILSFLLPQEHAWSEDTPVWQQLLCNCMLSTQLQPAVADLLERQEQQLGQPAGTSQEQRRHIPKLLTEWQHFTALSSVTIPSGGSNSGLPMLAQLTHLVHLDVGGGSFGDNALLSLTALRHLTELRVASFQHYWSAALRQRLRLPLEENVTQDIYVYHRVCEVRGAVASACREL